MGYKLSQLKASSAIVVIASLIAFADCQQPRYQIYPLPGGATAPESLAFDRDGAGPYTGVSDGRIIKWDARQQQWVNFAVTTPNRAGCEGVSVVQTITEARCGRTLGLDFNKKSGELYIADSYLGLLKVGPSGGLATSLATGAERTSFTFLNGLVVDQDTNMVYFTESSMVFPRSLFPAVIATGDRTGRLMKYDPGSKQVTVLLNNLTFPNGVALTEDGNYLLISETTTSRILKYPLRSPMAAGEVEVFANLPVMTDNIRRNHKGEFWVTSPTSLIGVAYKLDRNGTIIQVLKDKLFLTSSEAHEQNGSLWIGYSMVVPYAARLNISATTA